MSDYNKATNFTTKDSLPSGNSNKIVKGTELDNEFIAIASAIATKANIADPVFTGTPTVPTAASGTNTLQIANTAFVQGVLTSATVSGWTISDSNITLKTGTTATRPSTPTDGVIRFNTTTNQYEGNKTVSGSSILSITYSTTTATLTTNTPHGLSTGAYITVSGATPTNYNGNYNIVVTGAYSFTYVMASNPAANASAVGTYSVHQWTQIGGGATGGNADTVFQVNSQTVTSTYSIPSGSSASSAGPITVNSGVIITIPSGSRWVVL
jgi:hypothetical protein